jgi:cytochrome b561
VHESKKQCDGRPDEKRCEEAVDRREDALDDEADDALGTAWDDLWRGDLSAGGVSLPELHVLLGLGILAMAVLRLVWRQLGGLPPWAEALSASERFLEAWLEKALLLLLFVIPVTGLLLVAREDDWVGLHIGAHLTFFVVVGLHVALVLKHTLVNRNRHLARML